MSEDRSIPRVAESLDDLKRGQKIAWGSGGNWQIATVQIPETWDIFETCEVVILADPPAPPAPDWLVPADTMLALDEALRGKLPDEAEQLWGAVGRAARAVLDAATEVER